ncbi:hypothetical protein TYRP_019470, partial [Tyrophagus putrescentiae]
MRLFCVDPHTSRFRGTHYYSSPFTSIFAIFDYCFFGVVICNMSTFGRSPRDGE